MKVFWEGEKIGLAHAYREPMYCGTYIKDNYQPRGEIESNYLPWTWIELAVKFGVMLFAWSPPESRL